MTSRLEAGAASHVGRVRDLNEDSVHADEAAGLFVVADGMGGHRAGEVASSLAARTVVERMKGVSPAASPGELKAALRSAIVAAGRRVHEDGRRNPARRGMGTTLTALLLRGGAAVLSHIGDSRAYRYRSGELEQLTEDHSLHRGSSVLTRALGTEERARPETHERGARAGDVFLLASDGLTDEVPDPEIAEILARMGDGSGAAARAADDLVEAALSRGGRDNVTTVVVRVSGSDDDPS